MHSSSLRRLIIVQVRKQMAIIKGCFLIFYKIMVCWVYVLESRIALMRQNFFYLKQVCCVWGKKLSLECSLFEMFTLILTYFRFFKECICCLLASMLGFPLGVIQFVFIYHPLHDTFNIHTEVCVMMLVVVFGLILWMGDRNADRVVSSKMSRYLTLCMVGNFAFFFVVCGFFSSPEPKTQGELLWSLTVRRRPYVCPQSLNNISS